MRNGDSHRYRDRIDSSAIPDWIDLSKRKRFYPPPIAHAADASLTLDQKRNQAKQEAIDNFKFATTNLPKWNGTEVACYNSSTKTFTVDTPEKFAYALHYAGTYSGSTINITKDIDMGGREFANRSIWTNVTFEGNNHTIYNMKATGSGEAGICRSIASSPIRNVTFDTFYLYGNQFVGLFPKVKSGTPTGRVLFENVHARNGFSYAATTASNAGHVAAIFGNCEAMNSQQYSSSIPYIRNCSSENCFSYGNQHVGGTFGMYASVQFQNCYSKNDTVVAVGGHNGCLTSCSSRYSTYENCWASSTVFGESLVGGLTGYSPTCGGSFANCFSSCVIEGHSMLGGFVGACGMTSVSSTSIPLTPVAERKVSFTNCYTTSMVGMNYSGSQLGGFAGIYRYGTLNNCYAAGEVGSIDTNASSAVGSQGGFFGEYSYNPSVNASTGLVNCFYDMQTTAMKNKAVGGVAPLAMTRDANGVSTPSWNGIRGMTTEKMTGQSGLFSSGYVYAKGLYPQLSSMSAHSNLEYRAQSAASATTVFCDSWKDLSKPVFDTVRDTIRNCAFSSKENFHSNPQFSVAQVDTSAVKNISWKTDGVVSVLDRTSPVLSISESPYYTTSLSPGVEWAEISLMYSNGSATATGSRRLRLIPTSTIHAGVDERIRVICDPADAAINTTQLYDHNNGFNTTYLDAATLQSYLSGSVSHTSALKSFSNIASKTQTSNRIEGVASLTDHNKIVTSLTLFATLENANTGSIIEKDLSQKIQAQDQFSDGDFGLYRIRYRSTLPDGRYLSASKKVAVIGDYSVTYNYNYTGLLQGENISPDSIFSVTSGLKDFEGYNMHNYGDAPQRDGWNFSYWSLDQDGTRPVTQLWFDTYEKRTGNAAENVELYAQWTKETASVTAVVDPTIVSYLDGEIGEKTVITGAPGSRTLIDVATPPYKHTFSNWDADSLGGGTLEYDADMGLYIFTFGTAPATIPAGYDKITFKITWIDDRTGEVVEEQVVELDDPAVPPAPPHHSGYAFAGYDSDVWQKVTADGTVRILYDWDTIEVPETGGRGLYGVVMAVITLTCVLACATVAFVIRRTRLRIPE